MEEAIIKQEQTQPLARVHVFATSAEEMQRASNELLGWFERRVAQEREQLAQLETNLDNATKHKWNTKSWRTAITRAKAVLAYYEKAMEAVRAGYTIVPDLGADWFALRTSREKPPKDETDGHWRKPTKQDLNLPAEPEGQGEYVRSVAAGKFQEYKDEKENTRYRQWNTEFEPVEFPMIFVRPEIVRATAHAMSLKIFDAFGIVGNRKDPLVVGLVKGPKTGYVRKEMHFIVGWFLDTRTL